MYLALHGNVVWQEADRLALRVQDVEYEIFVPINRFSTAADSRSSALSKSSKGDKPSKLAKPSKLEKAKSHRVLKADQSKGDKPSALSKISVYVYRYLRENEEKIFGFPSLDERDLFIFLLTIKGVGPQLALSLLSHLDRNMLQDICEQNDVASLQKIPRIGKVTAEALIFELNRRKKKWKKKSEAQSYEPDEEQIKAMQVLEKLGYTEPEILSFFRSPIQISKQGSRDNNKQPNSDKQQRNFLAEDWIKFFLRQT